MVNTIIPIPGYVHLYRSLLRFYDMPENEVREMLYLLNTANLDCYSYYYPETVCRFTASAFHCYSPVLPNPPVPLSSPSVETKSAITTGVIISCPTRAPF